MLMIWNLNLTCYRQFQKYDELKEKVASCTKGKAKFDTTKKKAYKVVSDIQKEMQKILMYKRLKKSQIIVYRTTIQQW
jgi:hypothetical protein